MPSSASETLAEFKSQRMGGLLSGASGQVGGPNINTSLVDSAAVRMARSAPKKSSTAFLSEIRKSGQNLHQTAMQGFAAKQEAQRQKLLSTQLNGAPGASRVGTNSSATYKLPGGLKTSAAKGGPRGAYGLAVPAANAFGKLSSAYQKKWGVGLTVNSGGRTYQEQQVAYQKYLNGGPKAAQPGTSLHESGIAVDIGGPVTNAGSAQHAWLRQNAAQFGWYWVGQRYGEPWHWEYHPGGVS